MEVLEVELQDVTCWCDSTIVLCWLGSHPAKFKPFVANRISTATRVLPPSAWNHVPTSENPADCASRGMKAWELREHRLWWSGPLWLSEEPLLKPPQPQDYGSPEPPVEEVRVTKCNLIRSSPTLNLEKRFSSYRTLLHVVAWLLRAAHNFWASIKHVPLDRSEHLVVSSVRSAEILLIRESQWRSFPTEVQLLSATPLKSLSSKDKLLSLSPFVGSDGLLHVGGRLSKAPLPEAQRHPIMLSAHDQFTLLMMTHTHIQLSYCGPTLLLAHVGDTYHIVGVRRLARRICNLCTVCRKACAKAQTQQMGQLPPARVTPDHVFATTGIDYAGPFLLKRGYVRKPQFVKAYLALFVCFATKAIHIEVVSDQFTAAFLAALKRFCARRGRPQAIYSDNGSNFKGAKNELVEFTKFILEAGTSGSVHSYLLVAKTEWHFIPERAPHFGGLWEAAVRSAKTHLKKVVGEHILNFEEMVTVATQVEACLNSRPLGQLYSHSPDQVVPLTPGHFLIGRRVTAYPELAVPEKVSLCKRWMLCQALVQSFWKRWQREYLQQLQAKQKWRTPQKNLQVGELVLLTDANQFQSHWSLAKVETLYPGEDHLVRAVDVRVCKATPPIGDQTKRPATPLIKNSLLRRPITKLVRLFPEEDHEEIISSSPGGCLGLDP